MKRALLPLLLFFFGAGTPWWGLAAQTAPEARIPGLIDFGENGTQGVLTAPDSVGVGEDFTVTVVTFGGGCERAGDTSVVISATGVEVMVYDFTAATRPDVVCAAILKRMRHTVTVALEKPGEALIRVWGRRVAAETPPAGVPALLEHRITIR